jgi:hypothetical protein
MVVQIAVHTLKTDCAEKLFVVERTIRFFEDGVSFGRDASKAVIERHF